jgi:hypothetical protein
LSFEFFFAEYLLLLKPGIDYPYWHATCWKAQIMY